MATSRDYGLGEFDYPRGWMMVTAADRLSATPIEARVFGEDVVLYRGASGRPVMLDAYCPHMGAHLAVGPTGATALHCVQTEGDSIRCPNHGWKFGPDGQCTEIPYSRITIPKAMRIRSWQVQEWAGCIFAWHDPEGGAPTYELPALPEWADPRWMRWTIAEVPEMAVHQLELAEHGVDKIHNANVHGHDRLVGHRVTFDGHRAQTDSTSVMMADGAESAPFMVSSRYTGPALLLAYSDGPRPLIFFFAHTPTEDGKVCGFHGTMMRALGNAPDEEDDRAHAEIAAISLYQFNQDMEIFKRKRPTLKVVQIPGDGPFRRYRQWYSQFYAPRARTEAIQAAANGVIETEGGHDAPWSGMEPGDVVVRWRLAQSRRR